MMRAVRLVCIALAWIAGALLALVTLASLWDTNLWWVRLWDFPRVQIAAAAGLVLLAALCIPGRTRLALPLLMLAVIGYQVYRVHPYTPLASVEMEMVAEAPGSVRILSSNVLMENDRHDLLLEQLRQVDPDVLLLMETDADWLRALEPVLAGYATVLRAPRDDHYGMVFATRLPARRAEVVHLTGEDTPAIFAELRDPDGTAFRFVGLHPRPPVPGQSTAGRDAEIYLAARFARASDMPLVATGDFNDVAWSDTSRTFKHVGRYLDPRIGRGFYSSFDADRWWLRFPIDQLYMTPDVAVVGIERLPDIGSDHFPMLATVRFDAALAGERNIAPEPVTEAELEVIERAIRDAQGRLRAEVGIAEPSR